MIIRDHQSGRILGVVKQRPAWATEDNLRRIILMPALRHYTAALQFFREGRSSIAIAREMTHSTQVFGHNRPDVNPKERRQRGGLSSLIPPHGRTTNDKDFATYNYQQGVCLAGERAGVK